MKLSRKRADSEHVVTEILQNALRGETPPDCINLEEKHMPFWQAITEARAIWTTVDLIHAANLARCMSSIEENTKLLAEEGDVVINKRGTQIMNPRFSILEQLSRRSVALSQKIQVHAAATVGISRNQRGKNAAKKEALEAFKDMDDEDSLIARPN